MANARATVFNTTILGVETTRGSRVSCVKRLLATGINIKPNVPVKPFTPMGSKYPTTATRAKEHTEGTYEGALAYNDIVYILSGVLEAEAITTPTGATNTRQWAYNPAVFGPDDNKTYTLEMGSSVRAERTTYGLFRGILMRITKEEAHVSGALYGQVMTESVTLSTGRNEVQTVTVGTNTAGQFKLTYSAQQTADIDFDASHVTVQAALVALSNIAPGDVSVTGPAGGPWLVEFTGTLGSQNVSLMTLANGTTPLSGGSGQGVSTTDPGFTLADVPELPVDVNAFTLYVGDSLNNEVQLVTVQASGGTFTLTFTDPLGNSYTTTALAENAAAATVQTAMEVLANINAGDVVVTGSAGGPFTFTFGGRYAGLNLNPLTYDDGNLTGITIPAIAVTTSTSGGLTVLDKALEFEWSLDDRFTPRVDIRADKPSFTEHVEKAPNQKLTLVMEHDSTGASFMADMRNKTTKYIRLEAYGPVIETVGNYIFQYRMCYTWAFKFTADDRGDKDDTWASTFDLTPIDDNTLGGVVSVIIWNQLTALEY